MDDSHATNGASVLRDYLRSAGLSITKFCELTGLNRVKVQRLLKGQPRLLSVDFATRIWVATGGQVPVSCWSTPAARKAAEEAGLSASVARSA